MDPATWLRKNFKLALLAATLAVASVGCPPPDLGVTECRPPFDIPEKGVRYWISGTGSNPRDTSCGDNTKYAAALLGFLGFRVSKQELAVFVVVDQASVDFALIL